MVSVQSASLQHWSVACAADQSLTAHGPMVSVLKELIRVPKRDKWNVQRTANINRKWCIAKEWCKSCRGWRNVDFPLNPDCPEFLPGPPWRLGSSQTPPLLPRAWVERTSICFPHLLSSLLSFAFPRSTSLTPRPNFCFCVSVCVLPTSPRWPAH